MPRPAIHPGEILAEELTEAAITPTDLAEGRVQDFDANRIIERGWKLLAARSTSA